MIGPGGCTGEIRYPPVAAWITAESTHVFPDTDAPATPALRCDTGDALKLAAAIKETVAFQLVLTTDVPHTGNIGVRLEDLASPEARIKARHFRISRQLPVRVRGRPAWLICRSARAKHHDAYYDALLPVGDDEARNLFVPQNGNLALWIELTVPPGTQPGPYRSLLHVKDGPRTVLSVPIELVVWPFALPDRSDLTVLAPLELRALIAAQLHGGPVSSLPLRWTPDSPHYGAARRLLHAAMTMLHEHRCQPYLNGYYPVVKAGIDGDPSVDWTDYDELVGPFVDGSAYADRVASRWWPLPLDTAFPPPDRYGGPDGPGHRKFLAEYAGRCVEHFRTQGRAERSFVSALQNGQTWLGSCTAFEGFAGALGANGGGVKLVNPLPISTISEYGWRDPPAFPSPSATAIWAPPARYTSRAMAAEAQRQGADVWLRPGEPPFTGSLAIEAPPTDAHLLAWLAYSWGADTIWLDTVNRWPASVCAGRDLQASPPTDRWLIYPGAPWGLDVPLASLRLKRLRRGVQDYLYLKLLERQHRPRVASIMASTLVRFAGLDACGSHLADGLPFGWVDDPAVWSAARRLLAEQIVRAVEGYQPETGDTLVTYVGWASFFDAANKVRLLVEGIRLVVDEELAPAGRLRGRCFVQAINETRETVSGRLSVRTPPAPEDEAGQALSVPAAGRVPARVWVPFIRTPAHSSAGHETIELCLDLGEGGELAVASRLSYVVPLVSRTPPVIDGDLSDWPAGVDNVAADFRLVSPPRSGAADSGYPGGDLPTEPTTVFVTCDEQNLYFGFLCRDSHMDRLTVSRSNYIRYDELVPVGEDLVEVVIDPTNAGTSSPGDIYHIVVKANGSVITEKGIPTDPPIADHAPWPVPAFAAVRRDRAHWSVELSLPRSAFGDVPADPFVWAVNFARFHPRTAEYSNWTGTKFQIYSPRSLGNLIWPVPLGE